MEENNPKTTKKKEELREIREWLTYIPYSIRKELRILANEQKDYLDYKIGSLQQAFMVYFTEKKGQNYRRMYQIYDLLKEAGERQEINNEPNNQST